MEQSVFGGRRGFKDVYHAALWSDTCQTRCWHLVLVFASHSHSSLSLEMPTAGKRGKYSRLAFIYGMIFNISVQVPWFWIFML